MKCHIPVFALLFLVAAPTLAQAQILDIQLLRQVLGHQGTVQDGQFKIGVPQNDLDVTVDGFHIIPPMGMGSWAVFAPLPESGATVMGDVVLRESEVGAVESVLVEHVSGAVGL